MLVGSESHQGFPQINVKKRRILPRFFAVQVFLGVLMYLRGKHWTCKLNDGRRWRGRIQFTCTSRNCSVSDRAKLMSIFSSLPLAPQSPGCPTRLFCFQSSINWPGNHTSERFHSHWELCSLKKQWMSYPTFTVGTVWDFPGAGVILSHELHWSIWRPATAGSKATLR